jgi:hypothetical protein
VRSHVPKATWCWDISRTPLPACARSASDLLRGARCPSARRRLSRRKRFDGDVILAYTSLYAMARLVLEFFRADADRGFVLGGWLSTSQFIALILGPAAIALWFVRRQSAPAR